MIYQFTKIETAFDVESSMGRKVPYVKEILEASETELGSIYSYDVIIDLPNKLSFNPFMFIFSELFQNICNNHLNNSIYTLFKEALRHSCQSLPPYF